MKWALNLVYVAWCVFLTIEANLSKYVKVVYSQEQFTPRTELIVCFSHFKFSISELTKQATQKLTSLSHRMRQISINTRVYNQELSKLVEHNPDS